MEIMAFGSHKTPPTTVKWHKRMRSRHCWSWKFINSISSLPFLRGPQFYLAKIDVTSRRICRQTLESRNRLIAPLQEIISKVRNDTKNTARRTDSNTGSASCSCFRYDTVSGRPSRIQLLKWPILKQNPSTFGWDMTQNILGRPDTVSYPGGSWSRRTRACIAICSPSRIFCIVSKLVSCHHPWPNR